MTFLFEDCISGDTIYVNASNIYDAIGIFKSRKESFDSSDFEYIHIYVRIL